MNGSARMERQYGALAQLKRIVDAVHAEGHDPKRFDHAVLAQLEEFHSLGRRGTVALADAAAVAVGESVLDVGCGIGGPARHLADERGCAVTGVDLCVTFCAIARELNRRTGFGEAIAIQHADALALPFDDASFDVVWSQHAAMNVADKPALYRELRRVCRPGGRLAFFDVVAGSGEEIDYPVPWADGPEASHLVCAEEVRRAVEGAGFAVLSWEDATGELAHGPGPGPGGPMPATSIGVELLVPDFRLKAAMMRVNVEAGRVELVRCIARAEAR